MNKLLVNAPSGAQEIIEVGVGGGYFDAERVVWDERDDGSLPEITIGGMVRAGDALGYSQERMDQHIEATKPPVPQSVTMRQARLVLLGAGMLAQVEATIAALPEPDRTAATIEWEYSQEVQRHNGFVAMLGPMLGLDDGQLDALFIQAATL